MPGGALDVIADGWLDGVSSAFGLHCDPALEVGRVGLKSGPITAASDQLEVRVTGPGGHTSRPQNTVDLVHVLATVATGLPQALSRLVDPGPGSAWCGGTCRRGWPATRSPAPGRCAGRCGSSTRSRGRPLPPWCSASWRGWRRRTGRGWW